MNLTFSNDDVMIQFSVLGVYSTQVLYRQTGGVRGKSVDSLNEPPAYPDSPETKFTLLPLFFYKTSKPNH